MFDGETSLRSTAVQARIKKELNINVQAKAFYKRNLAERAIREIKLRMALLLSFKQQSLKYWNDYLPQVLTTINNHSARAYKSNQALLTAYFTQPNLPWLPQQTPVFKYNIGDKVYVDCTPAQRKQLNFKWTFNKGRATAAVVVVVYTLS